MSDRTFRANANFWFEYTREIDEGLDPDKVLDGDKQFFEEDPMALHENYDFTHCEVDIDDITDRTTPEEVPGMADMEPRLEHAIRDWWNNRQELDALRRRETELASQKSKLLTEEEEVTSLIHEYTAGFDRNLMLKVFEDYFVSLIWIPGMQSHKIEIVRNEYGDKS